MGLLKTGLFFYVHVELQIKLFSVLSFRSVIFKGSVVCCCIFVLAVNDVVILQSSIL